MTQDEQAFEALPSQAYLSECFDYFPESGLLIWKYRPIQHFTAPDRNAEWEMKKRNSRLAGAKFGATTTLGYVRGRLDRSQLYAHRIIWKLVHGVDPEIIDHINGDPTDNRIGNLRNGTRSDNQKNMRLSSANSSGVAGVYHHKQSGGWYARIPSLDGAKCTFFSKSKEAVVAWRQEKQALFGYSGRV